ncbi:AraC family transcriptional regulator [Oscillatoria laete-virens NRMC-F 0139]|nr:AraC family transcriptional regulator [Oscillatoria laete-virens]MDL5055215.1 AraC family transcriptional regulator [Oscillatoria laete-virens NRMC-F 0139]
MSPRTVVDLRKHGIPEIPVVGHYEYRAAREALPDHNHPQAMEICYLAKGRQLYRMGHRDYLLKGGDIFVTLPGEEHSTGGAPEEKGSLYWMHILLPRGRRKFLNHEPGQAAVFVRELLHIRHRLFPGNPGVGTLFDQIFTVAQSADSLRQIRLRNRVEELLLAVLACARAEPTPGVSPVMSQMLRYIEANAHQSLPLAVLAARAGLSLPRFKSRFKQETGIPPAEYVLRCKIGRAKELLVLPRATVTGVAVELNFPSSQYFATVFRRYTGLRPSQFIQTHKGK